ncbi:MAG: hypothetical protein H6679_01910 [Epsilonproteobacteria bacterium]|nr:hypothetical protein [Campylobacterota bacterium]
MRWGNNLGERILSYLTSFCQAQLVVLVISLPILISWGLGISVMSMFGNLCGVPLLTLFLLLSSLLFFSELLGLPNGFLVSLLEKHTQLCDWLICSGKKEWLFFCPQPPSFVLLALLVCSCITLCWLHGKSMHMRLQVMLALVCTILLCAYSYQAIFMPVPVQYSLDEKLFLIKDERGKTYLVDDGFFNRKKSADKTVEFELKQFLAKKLGSVCIDCLYVLRPTMSSFKAAHAIAQRCQLKAVQVPFFDYKLSKAGWAAFFTLRRYCFSHNIAWKRHHHPNIPHFHRA